MSLYNCKEQGANYQVTKFTPDLEVESSYLTSTDSCECPAGHRHTCRHRQMLPLFEQKGATRGQWFLDFDRKTWVAAVTEEALEESVEALEQEAPNLTATEIDERIANYSGPIPGDALVAEVVGHAFSMLDLAAPVGNPRPTTPAKPLSPTVTTAGFDPADGGSTPPVVAKTPFLRRI